MHWLIGDLQGCCGAFTKLLQTIDFSPSRDHLVVLGDLVNRGPASLDTLRTLMRMEGAAEAILGNHDLHALAVAHGLRSPSATDTLTELLAAPDAPVLLEWLRHRPLAWQHAGWLCVHAGVLPDWTVEGTLALAQEVQAVLRGPDLADWLRQMYGNAPDAWSEDLAGANRLRCIVNALTRLRYCDAQGRMDFLSKESAAQAPEGLMPWFAHPGRQTADAPVAFGHWSTLGLLNTPTLLGLDTGCVWGGQLTAVRVDGGRREVVQVKCAQAQVPGKR
jgi:bis(5'-nucleosyl)-tetraphosphatase (symmetrical)